MLILFQIRHSCTNLQKTHLVVYLRDENVDLANSTDQDQLTTNGGDVWQWKWKGEGRVGRSDRSHEARGIVCTSPYDAGAFSCAHQRNQKQLHENEATRATGTVCTLLASLR